MTATKLTQIFRSHDLAALCDGATDTPVGAAYEVACDALGAARRDLSPDEADALDAALDAWGACYDPDTGYLRAGAAASEYRFYRNYALWGLTAR